MEQVVSGKQLTDLDTLLLRHPVQENYSSMETMKSYVGSTLETQPLKIVDPIRIKMKEFEQILELLHQQVKNRTFKIKTQKGSKKS